MHFINGWRLFGMGITIILAAASAVILLFFYEVPQENRNIVNIALGTLLSMGVTVTSYFFGSSQNASDHTESTRVAAEKLAEQVITTANGKH